MTENEKQLLLKDLCARLPYGVKMRYKDEEGVSTLCQIDTFYTDVDGFHCLIRMAEPPGIFYDLNEFKPYLRPMSSMTEDEKKKLKDMHCLDNADALVSMKEQGAIDNPSLDFVQLPRTHSFDFMNSIHVDYRGLIEKGLALEAPEGMYENIHVS